MKPIRFAAYLTAILIAATLTLQFSCTPPPEAKKPNQPPVIESVNYAKDAFANSDMQLDCTAKDAEGDNLTYSWMPAAGEIIGTGSSVLWVPPGKMGTYPITLAVSDNMGGIATENISIRVVTNADGTSTPLLELKLNMGDTELPTIYKQRIRNWFEMDILCITEDAGNAGDLNYTWSATGGELKGKELEGGKANKIRWKAPGVKGDYTISVTVNDSTGREAKGQVIATVFCCGDS